MDQKPDGRPSFWEKYQQFSEKYYAPYVAWSYKLKTNLIVIVIAVAGLGLFYFAS